MGKDCNMGGGEVLTGEMIFGQEMAVWRVSLGEASVDSAVICSHSDGFHSLRFVLNHSQLSAPHTRQVGK